MNYGFVLFKGWLKFAPIIHSDNCKMYGVPVYAIYSMLFFWQISKTPKLMVTLECCAFKLQCNRFNTVASLVNDDSGF